MSALPQVVSLGIRPPARPTPLKPKLDSIPLALRDYVSWVHWVYEMRDGRWTKPPRRAAGNGFASTTDSSSWATFEVAQHAVSRVDGLGLVLVEDLVGLDLDHVIDVGGVIEPWANEIVERFSGCYTERSPGGDGIRIFCRGVAGRSGKGGPENRLEVYDRKSPRYLTVTGHSLRDGGVIEAQESLDWLASAFMARADKDSVAPKRQHRVVAGSMSDSEVLDRASTAKNGAKFNRLFISGNADGGDDSSADLALANLLVFWTQDEAQIDRLFRRSALMRPKWDSSRGETTYGEMTIRKALGNGGERFAPKVIMAPKTATRRDIAADVSEADPEQVSDRPSEDAVALAFVERHSEYRFVSPLHRWLRWDGKQWRDDSTGRVYAQIRELVRELVKGGKAERATANAAFVSGVERLLRTDQRVATLPEQLDADPLTLNTETGLVDLRTGAVRPHDPLALCTRITHAPVAAEQGRELWARFLHDITLGDAELEAYLQRVAGYAATGLISEDCLVYPFGPGANGKSSWAEAVAHALGDYAKTFAAEVLMESKGERHPTELAQFVGVRLALTSEPASNAAWNDSRIKSLTGDAVISARVMRGDPFTFARTHKTIVLGNHMPRLSEVTHAIRRRVQMVPFRAVFPPSPGVGMRERLKSEASGAILAWIVEGARLWLVAGTAPPKCVVDLTEEYLSDQDLVGQWLDQRCERHPTFSQLSGELYRSYANWCEAQGAKPKSNMALSAQLVATGFEKRSTFAGKLFKGLRLRLTT